jgi:hypothetical protein
MVRTGTKHVSAGNRTRAACFRVADPDPDWIRIQSGQWTRIRNGIQPKMLDPDPDETNADPQPWLASQASTLAKSY